MTPMERLRQSSRPAILALVWFALTQAVAVAAPLLSSGNTQVICSAAGATLVPTDDDSSQASHARLHCPLCLTHLAAAPPPSPQTVALLPIEQAVPGLPAGVVRALGTVTPPQRAPPGIS